MKKIKYLILICIFCNTFNVFTQDMDYNCNIDMENYVFIDSLMLEINLVDYEKIGKYLYPKNFVLIASQKEYNSIKSFNAKNIDFEKYNLFVGFFNSYGVCCTPRVLPIKFSLLFDKRNNQNIVSIIQYIRVPYLKLYCLPYFITAIIPKEYCNKICYTKKLIENEN